MILVNYRFTVKSALVWATSVFKKASLDPNIETSLLYEFVYYILFKIAKY